MNIRDPQVGPALYGFDELAAVVACLDQTLDKAESDAYAAKHIIKLLPMPFKLADTAIVASASIGISVYPDDTGRCPGW